jgi:hypothetical protein
MGGWGTGTIAGVRVTVDWEGFGSALGGGRFGGGGASGSW